MVFAPSILQTQWISICSIDRITPNTGVCALVNGEQVAIFRIDEILYAVSNYDPFSKAFVLSRGIVGDRNGKPKVASPIYKQNFCLSTGQCLDDEFISIPAYPVRVADDQVQIGIAA